MKVEIVYSTSNKIGSRFIRFLTSGKWSHCGLFRGATAIDSTAFKGVDETPMSSWASGRDYEILDVTCLVDPSKRDDAERFIKETLGAKYDFHYFKSLLNPFRKRQVYVDGKDVFRCDEWVRQYLITYGVDCLDQPWSFRVSPESLYQILSALVKQHQSRG